MAYAQADHPAIPAAVAGAQPKVRILDWVESQACVTRIWLDQLIAEGDPDDLVSLIHRQSAWLDMMRERLAKCPPETG